MGISAVLDSPGKSRVLAAAAELAAEYGSSGVTINRVCGRAGVTPPTIYYHFGSKQGLLGAVIEMVANVWLEQLVAQQPVEGDLESRLHSAVNSWQAMIEAPSRPLKLLLSVQLEASTYPQEVRDAMSDVLARARQIVVEGLTHVTGDLAHMNEIAYAVLGLVQSAALEYYLDDDRVRLRTRLIGVTRVMKVLIAHEATYPPSVDTARNT